MNIFTIPHQALFLCVLPFLANCGEKNTFAPPPPTPVGVQSAIIRDQMTYHEFPGHLQALQTVELRARVKGILKTISPDFKPGEKIKAGTVVFEIDDVPYQAALQAAESNLAKAKADLDVAEITLRRRETAAEAISKIQIDVAKADVSAADALVKSAEASVLDAKETLSWCKITAPSADASQSSRWISLTSSATMKPLNSVPSWKMTPSEFILTSTNEWPSPF